MGLDDEKAVIILLFSKFYERGLYRPTKNYQF